MTVRELIELLSTHDPDLAVYVSGYEGGVDDLTPEGLMTGRVERHANPVEQSYFGRHDFEYDDPRMSRESQTWPRWLVLRGPL